MIERIKNNKIVNISKDFGLNLLASLVTTGVTQLILYPGLAYILPSERYGELLTVMGIANTIGVACGGSLNNTRLIVQEKYDEGQEKGDFSTLLWLIALSAAVVSFVVFAFFYKQSFATTAFITLFTVLCLIRSYISVEYRIVLNYKRIFFSNVFVAVGNLIGVLIYAMVGKNELWPIPFLLGEIIGFVYIFKTTIILNEPLKKTKMFNEVVGKETVLLISSLSANVLTYLDRLLLLPLLGGVAVSCYTIASVFGKSLGILLTPLAGVMLSYYAQKGFKMSKNLFWKINFAIIAVGGFFVLICLCFAPFFTKILYSSMYDDAKPYLIIANITAIVNVIANMTQPSVLKFAPVFWQLIIQAIYCIVYLVGGMIVTQNWGLWGFSVIALVASIIKVLLLFVIGSKFIKND